MNTDSRALLLLSSRLGDPLRRPLSQARFRMLTQNVRLEELLPSDDCAMTSRLLMARGIEKKLAEQAEVLLRDGELLDAYLSAAAARECYPLTAADPDYPSRLVRKLGKEAPVCLWWKGDRDLLAQRAVALVGSRDLKQENRRFAEAAGYQAAVQGFVLVSGNARGADSAGQNACLRNGGSVVCVVADSLYQHEKTKNVLFLSEDGWDEPFSVRRALQRNYVIHALGEVTFAVQSEVGQGGTWHGSVHNLRNHWSPLYCCRDGSAASEALEDKGADLIGEEELSDLLALTAGQISMY